MSRSTRPDVDLLERSDRRSALPRRPPACTRGRRRRTCRKKNSSAWGRLVRSSLPCWANCTNVLVHTKSRALTVTSDTDRTAVAPPRSARIVVAAAAATAARSFAASRPAKQGPPPSGVRLPHLRIFRPTSGGPEPPYTLAGGTPRRTPRSAASRSVPRDLEAWPCSPTSDSVAIPLASAARGKGYTRRALVLAGATLRR